MGFSQPGVLLGYSPAKQGDKRQSHAAETPEHVLQDTLPMQNIKNLKKYICISTV